jgi:heme-degrading monooxygenase HmoA
MIGVLTHHWAKPDRLKEAHQVLDRNGLAQSKFPGFAGRHTLVSLSDSTKITTLVLWASSEIYDAWRASEARAAAMAGSELLWAQPPVSERFEVTGGQNVADAPTHKPA